MAAIAPSEGHRTLLPIYLFILFGNANTIQRRHFKSLNTMTFTSFHREWHLANDLLGWICTVLALKAGGWVVREEPGFQNTQVLRIGSAEAPALALVAWHPSTFDNKIYCGASQQRWRKFENLSRNAGSSGINVTKAQNGPKGILCFVLFLNKNNLVDSSDATLKLTFEAKNEVQISSDISLCKTS